MKKCRMCRIEISGGSHCDACKKKNRDRSKSTRNRHIKNGECVKCGHKLRSNAVYRSCDKCRHKLRLLQRHRKQACADNGLCFACGKNLLMDGFKRCRECIDKSRRQEDKRKLVLAEKGLCENCGIEPCLPTSERSYAGIGCVARNVSRTCRICYLKRIAGLYLGTSRRYGELLDIFETQGGRCAYTGVTLAIGDNASVDHKMPISRFPDLAGDTNNFEWITIQVNLMKRDCTKEEFLAIIRQISERHGAQYQDDDDLPHG